MITDTISINAVAVITIYLIEYNNPNTLAPLSEQGRRCGYPDAYVLQFVDTIMTSAQTTNIKKRVNPMPITGRDNALYSHVYFVINSAL